MRILISGAFPWYNLLVKTCSKCKQQKPLIEFGKDKQKRDGLTSRCKECTRPSCREYGRQHKERRKRYFKAYKLRNAEKMKEYHRKYTIEHKEHILAYGKEWREANRAHRREAKKQRLKQDVQFKLRETLRTRLYIATKRRRARYQGGSIAVHLGCSIAEFKVYIERLFTDGMNWNNRSEWHLDHIKPLADFDLTNQDDLKIVCHFTNLRPLWARDNLTKGRKCAF